MNDYSQIDISSTFSPLFQEYFCPAQHAQMAEKNGIPDHFTTLDAG
jgi:hypothetical protein